MKCLTTKLEFLRGVQKHAGWVAVLMVYRNKTGRLGSGFISVCFRTCCLGPKSGFYVPERPCTPILQALLCFP